MQSATSVVDNAFDAAALKALLDATLAGPKAHIVITIEKGVASNRTYRVTRAGHAYVLRQQPKCATTPRRMQSNVK